MLGMPDRKFACRIRLTTFSMRRNSPVLRNGK
jgi:hypothetical protein